MMSNVIHTASRCLFQTLHGAEHRIFSATPKNTSICLNMTRSWSSIKPDATEEQKTEESPTEEQVQDKSAGDEIAKLNESISELKDKYQRSLAENENVRKRLRKEISESKLYAIQGFCKDLLDVADVLSTAVSSVPEEILKQSKDSGEKQWTDFYDGVTLTKSELLSVFKRHGLEPFTPEKGEKFDPNIHEAMFQAPIDGMESGLVAHVQSTGYTLHGRTLRPAQVGVSK